MEAHPGPKAMTATTGYLARERSCVTPRFEAYEGDDPIKYAISLNLVRRRFD